MNALFEMQVRVGGDPRGFDEFAQLGEELAKLNHPACPEVDWARVEQLCLVLFQVNGADLQTAAFFVLARSQRYGLSGLLQGVALLNGLGNQWPRLWPNMASVRRDVLGWLFAQLPVLLRNWQLGASSSAGLVQLGIELQRLSQLLEQQGQGALPALQQLRQQVARLGYRQEQVMAMGSFAPQAASFPAQEPLMPVLLVAPPPQLPPGVVVRRERRWGVYGAMAVLATFVLTCSAWWLGSYTAEQARLASSLPPPPAQAVRLDSLMLFDAGSAELKQGSTKVLVNALMGIRAQPGWLIEISGHTDASGDFKQNLLLSHARAGAVRDWMQGMAGIPEHCFSIKGLAASQPVASNDHEAGRVANRRVDIRLVPEPGACQPAVKGEGEA